MVNALSTRSSFPSMVDWRVNASLSHTHTVENIQIKLQENTVYDLGIASNTHILTCKQGLIQRQFMTGFIEDAHTDVDWTQESEWIFRKHVQVTFNPIFKRICIMNLFFTIIKPIPP